jgi:protein TonB
MTQKEAKSPFRFLRSLLAVVAAAAFTLGIFLILPFMQTIGTPPEKDLVLQNVDLGKLPPPPPAPPEEEPQEQEQPEQAPEFVEQAAPLELSQLELALNPGFGEGLFGDFTVRLTNQLNNGNSDAVDQIFSLADLDQRPRVLFQRMPTYPPELRKRNRQGTVYVVFRVDTRGKVVGPKVDRSTDPAFDRAALEAVRQWKFEPGTRNGEKVQFKMRVPITFNAA